MLGRREFTGVEPVHVENGAIVGYRGNLPVNLRPRVTLRLAGREQRNRI
jgi:hypothetical protein